MRLHLFLLFLLLSATSFAQPPVSGDFEFGRGGFTANGLFDQIFLPCANEGIPTAMSFLGFGNACDRLLMRQIRVVAPELDGIINTTQNPALLRQPKAYQSTSFDYTPWQPYASSFSDSYALKASIQKQFKPGGSSWAIGYENYSASAGLFRRNLPVTGGFSIRNQLAYLSYARPFAKYWTLGLTAKYVSQRDGRNNTFFSSENKDILAADLGVQYRNRKRLNTYQELVWQWGVSLTNLGPKVQDNNFFVKMPIPTTLSMGFLLEERIQFRNRSVLRLTGTYQFNKLLVPSACTNCDDNSNSIPDYQEYSALGGMLASFSDAPGGFGEELQEINHQFEMSARYNFTKRTAISLQASLFHQNPQKGNFQVMTTRFGLHLGRFQFEISNWSPTLQWNNERTSSSGFSLGYQQFIGE